MNDEQLLRYSRQILLPQIDVQGQEKMLAARVLLIGMGGLGSPAAMYLAAAGVGELVLVDDDCVDETNLQRQIVYTEKHVGELKVESAKQTLQSINTAIKIATFTQRLDVETMAEQVAQADVVLDCSDNLETRQRVNRICFERKKPLVSGAAIRMEGQLVVFDFRDDTTPCYQCLYAVTGEEPLSCSQSGILGPVVGIVGTHQALEALKIIAGVSAFARGRLGIFDGVKGEWRYLNFAKDLECVCCGS